MRGLLVFISVLCMGLGLRFTTDWVWWADLAYILVVAVSAAALAESDRPRR